MNSFKEKAFYLINYLLLIFSCSLPLEGQYFPHPPEPWRAEYEFSLKDFEFSHPSTVISGDELDIIKLRILYDVEPQKTAFRKLKEEADASLTFIPNAPKTLEIPGGYVDPAGLEYARNLLWANCHTAYSCALVYALTGEGLYAEKAIEVLMNWAKKGTTFYGNDSGLQLGSYFSPMLYAADLIHDYTGWEESDRVLFKSWWRANCLLDGDVLGVLRRKDNNWKDAALLGTFAASVVLEDTLLLKEALIQLKSYFFSRTDADVDLPGKAWKIAVDQHGVYLPREVVRNDGRSGLTYTAYALTTMVQAMEIARYAGFDFWQDTTELGATLGDVIKQYFAWDVLNESFPWNKSPNKSDKRRNAYELANLKYDVSPDFITYVNHSRPITGREGDEYSTLNKGDMTGTDTIPPVAPTNLTTKTLSGTKINLTWNNNAVNEYGLKIERSSGQEFFLIDSLTTGVEFYLDTGLIADTDYTYRVFSFNASDQVLYSNESVSRTQVYPENPPGTPTGFKATVISSEQIELSWNDNSDSEEGYLLERKTGEEFVEIAHLGVNDTLYNDTGLDANTTYSYRIQSYNLAGYSGYSDQEVATTLANGGKFQSENGIVSMEAEYGELGSIWLTGLNELASGGKYLEINPTRNYSGENPECDLPLCLTSYYFTIKEEGKYRFWFRTMSEGDENDSFFWRIGTDPWIRENGRSGIGEWHYTENDRLNNLAADDYIMEIAYRENGTRLDKFLFQLDNLEPPTGTGPVQSIGLFPLPPNKPASLVANTLSSSSLKIQWSDNAYDELGYIIERKENDSFIELAQLEQNANAYTDTGLTVSSSYSYRVYAFNASGKSNYSNEDSARTLSPASFPLYETQENSLQAYPNPFTEKTSFSFYLNKASKASLIVYNTIGQQMVYLGGEMLNQGWQQLEWDGKDKSGNQVPAGIYFCHFQNEASVKKTALILIKQVQD